MSNIGTITEMRLKHVKILKYFSSTLYHVKAHFDASAEDDLCFNDLNSYSIVILSIREFQNVCRICWRCRLLQICPIWERFNMQQKWYWVNIWRLALQIKIVDQSGKSVKLFLLMNV